MKLELNYKKLELSYKKTRVELLKNLRWDTRNLS